jgi:hypothetical protein
MRACGYFWEGSMEGDFDRAYRAARRAYEMGRLRRGAGRALVVAALAASCTAVVLGWRSLVWLPVTVVTWSFIEWRGAWLREGARRGLLAGMASLFLPLSVLRPCCSSGVMAADCCATAMPSTCAGAGALLGVSLALLLPRAPRAQRLETAFGMALGTAAVAALRCGPLLLGEAVGLLGGLMAGVAAASLARAWMDHRTA